MSETHGTLIAILVPGQMATQPNGIYIRLRFHIATMLMMDHSSLILTPSSNHSTTSKSITITLDGNTLTMKLLVTMVELNHSLSPPLKPKNSSYQPISTPSECMLQTVRVTTLLDHSGYYKEPLKLDLPQLAINSDTDSSECKTSLLVLTLSNSLQIGDLLMSEITPSRFTLLNQSTSWTQLERMYSKL